MDRKQIWARNEKKRADQQGVEQGRYIPTTCAACFPGLLQRLSRRVVRLADVLGHSSIETTRIHLLSTGKECIRQLDKLGLVQ